MKSLLKTLLFATTLLAASLPAQALTIAPYSADALATAQKAGKPVALQFHAPWCPTCRAQDKALEVLKAEPGAVDVQLLVVDYDSEGALKQALKVRTQSTLIVYHGVVEKTRAIGITTPDDIRAVLRQAL
jgi:thiol-disulfide isomerase/thioredoxin